MLQELICYSNWFRSVTSYLPISISYNFYSGVNPDSGKVVSKFCAKYLHSQVLKHELHLGGDLAASVRKAFFRYNPTSVFQYLVL